MAIYQQGKLRQHLLTYPEPVMPVPISGHLFVTRVHCPTWYKKLTNPSIHAMYVWDLNNEITSYLTGTLTKVDETQHDLYLNQDLESGQVLITVIRETINDNHFYRVYYRNGQREYVHDTRYPELFEQLKELSTICTLEYHATGTLTAEWLARLLLQELDIAGRLHVKGKKMLEVIPHHPEEILSSNFLDLVKAKMKLTKNASNFINIYHIQGYPSFRVTSKPSNDGRILEVKIK